LVLVGLTGEALSTDPKPAEKSKETVLQVPTSGSILDVTYLPEFEEWWVKCREGDKIVVYSYDRLSKNWRKVIFEIKKPEPTAAARKPDAPKPTPHPPSPNKPKNPRRKDLQPPSLSSPKGNRKKRHPRKRSGGTQS